jgi:hypothetical protein
MARILAFLACWIVSSAWAAASAVAVTPQRSSVAGGESQVFAARFFDALGNPSVGESVTFSNDACGFFPNGQFATTVVTDATGLAQTTFTARNAGITCRVTANAGVALRFDVLTYVATNAYLQVTSTPAVPGPGQPFTLEVRPKVGAYDLYNSDITARVTPGAASASISPGSANTGQVGAVTFSVTPDNRLGDYTIDLGFRDRVQQVTMTAPANPWQDMWWAGLGENGWGMSVVQHNDVLFAVVYAYDAQGKPTWYVMPGGTWDAAHTKFTGAVYSPRGSPYSAYDVTRFQPGAPVGNITLTFGGVDSATLDYTINGVSGTKVITRMDFGSSDGVAHPAVGDMWWGGSTQDGWGVAFLQQFGAVFGVWFTYDGTGAPTWFVMPGGNWIDASSWAGQIYRTTSAPWLGRAYDPMQLRATNVGSFDVRFSGSSATFDYTIDGQSGTLALSKQPF